MEVGGQGSTVPPPLPLPPRFAAIILAWLTKVPAYVTMLSCQDSI